MGGPLTAAAIVASTGAVPADVDAAWPAVEEALGRYGLDREPLRLLVAAAALARSEGSFRPLAEPVEPAWAARVYDGRADLGNTRRGDGHRYRARGFVDLRGRSAYRAAADAIALPLERRPELALRPAVAARLLVETIVASGAAASADAGDWDAAWRRLSPCFEGWERFVAALRRLETGTPGTPIPAPVSLRTIGLTSPYTEGEDVRAIQAALGVAADGLYGPITAGAAVAWKRRSGYPARELTPQLEPLDQLRLLGSESLPPAYRRRARERAAVGPELVPSRAVAEMEAWARDGVREQPPGSNRVPLLARLAAELGVAAAQRDLGYPWCALAAFLAALRVGGQSARACLVDAAFNGLYCPAILATAQAGAYGLRVVAAGQAARGDLVLFDWSPEGDPTDHLGRLVGPPADGVVRTVDGNTLDGQVALRERPATTVRAFVRDS